LASGLAGAKAGILGGIFFGGAIGLFNIAIVEVFSGSVLTTFQNPTICIPPATPQACFSTLVTALIPSEIMFPVALAGILYGAIYGLYYEFLPGKGYQIRAAAIGLLLLVTILFFRIAGVTTDATQEETMLVFDLLATVGYIAILARFYRRFTREVQFQSPNPQKLTITVDRKNFTGKVRTFSVHSSHTIRAPGESGAFHQWLVSGGVSVLDARSFETTMRVDGDGLLKIS
jgi:hypothetical protein